MTLKPQTTRNYKRKTKQGRLEDSKGSTFFTNQDAVQFRFDCKFLDLKMFDFLPLRLFEGVKYLF